MSDDTNQKKLTCPVGTQWVRADFHLHTKADKEFKVSEEEKAKFSELYVTRLEQEEIKVGVITNHNKFDRDEFRELNRVAKKKNILLLPGVELSVNDGKNGVHVLIVCDPESWLVSDHDFIDTFLTSAFEGIRNRENENQRCNFNLMQLFERLDVHRKEGRDSFCIFAHVEQPNGFLEELDGGRISQLGETERFRENVLALQKIRTRAKVTTLNQWLKNQVPCFVEGSDPKALSQVGEAKVQKNQEKKTYIKIGSYTHAAVKFALLNCDRIKEAIPSTNHGFIEEVSFTGGIFDSQLITLNENLNCLVGIRGSGKSSLLELIRYGLNVSLGSQAKDADYKNGLAKFALGSGGKISIRIRDKHGRRYNLTRIYNEQPRIESEGSTVDYFNIAEEVLHLRYFGQKDLSEIGSQGFADDLSLQFFGQGTQTVDEQLVNAKKQLEELINNRNNLEENIETKEQLAAQKSGLEQKKIIYEQKNVADKLKKQAHLSSDIDAIDKFILSFSTPLRQLKTKNEEVSSLSKGLSFLSPAKDYPQVTKSLEIAVKIDSESSEISTRVASIQALVENLKVTKNELAKKKEESEEEFAEIRRECKVDNLDPDDFLTISQQIIDVNRKLEGVAKSEENRAAANSNILAKVKEISSLSHSRFVTVKSKMDDMNSQDTPITFAIDYRGDKERYLTFLQQFFQGLGVNKQRLTSLTESFPDPIELYLDIQTENASRLTEVVPNVEQRTKIVERIVEKSFEFLSFKVPDKIILLYNKVEIAKHSLGQRASALILFLLMIRDTGVLLIDQPEDDLDSQSIFRDVIKEIVSKKSGMQFLFATHNPNIPVLGDAEQVVRCKMEDGKSKTLVGSIDDQGIQKEIIDIMEGGEDAFRIRRQIYQLWSGQVK